MEEIAKELDTALKLISTLTVSGDSVDVVAVAKNCIRSARAAIINMPRQGNQTRAPEQ